MSRFGKITAVLFGAGFGLSLLPLADEERAAYRKAVVYVLSVLLLGAMIYACWPWAVTGFDH